MFYYYFTSNGTDGAFRVTFLLSLRIISFFFFLCFLQTCSSHLVVVTVVLKCDHMLVAVIVDVSHVTLEAPLVRLRPSSRLPLQQTMTARFSIFKETIA